MATTTTSTAPQFVMIDEYLMDVVLDEVHTYDSIISDYPVESGSTISDNIRIMPISVSMDCLVSNTPIGFIANERDNDDDDNPPKSAYEVLTAIRDDKRLVTIKTSLRPYVNMWLKTLTVPRATGRGDELRFTALFAEVQFVVNERTTVKTATPMGTPPKAKGGSPPAADLRGLFGIVNAKELYATGPRAGQVRYAQNNYWYDSAIHGWREGVRRPEIVPGTATVALNGDGSHIYTIDDAVNVRKGRPYGWDGGLDYSNDNSVKATLDAAYAANKTDIGFTTPGSSGGNPYDPFAVNLNPPYIQVRGVQGT